MSKLLLYANITIHVSSYFLLLSHYLVFPLETLKIEPHNKGVSYIHVLAMKNNQTNVVL